MLPVIFGAAVAALLFSLDQASGAARQRWESRQAELRRRTALRRQEIERHLREAALRAEFYSLVNQHHLSDLTANEVHALLEDANCAVSSYKAAIRQATQQIHSFKAQLKGLPAGDTKVRIQAEVDGLRQFRQELYRLKEEVDGQRAPLLAEVRALNAETVRLREMIRTSTGTIGEEWYARLEARKRLRRAGLLPDTRRRTPSPPPLPLR